MGQYKQLSKEERGIICESQKSGKSGRQIAALLCRDKGTISRELRRNDSDKIGYLPDTAGAIARQRKRRNSRIFRSVALTRVCNGRVAFEVVA